MSSPLYRPGKSRSPPDTEERLAGFTELVATAIADTQARAELDGSDQQAALRRVATLVARAATPPAVFAAVAEEIGRLIPTDAALVNRYNQDGTHTVMGTWSSTGNALALGERTLLGGDNVTTLVSKPADRRGSTRTPPTTGAPRRLLRCGSGSVRPSVRRSASRVACGA